MVPYEEQLIRDQSRDGIDFPCSFRRRRRGRASYWLRCRPLRSALLPRRYLHCRLAPLLLLCRGSTPVGALVAGAVMFIPSICGCIWGRSDARHRSP